MFLSGIAIRLSRASGATRARSGVVPFGAIRAETKNATNAPDYPIKFTGELLDPTGFYYLRARQYDPVTGRFLRTDPAPGEKNEPATSAYAYAGNSPTVFVDPTGETKTASIGLQWAAIVTSPDESATSASPDASGEKPPSGLMKCGGVVVDGVTDAFGGYDTVKGKIFPPHGVLFAYWARVSSGSLFPWGGAFQVGFAPRKDLTVSFRGTWLRSQAIATTQSRNIYPYRVRVANGNPSGQTWKVIVEVFSPHPCGKPDPVK